MVSDFVVMESKRSESKRFRLMLNNKSVRLCLVLKFSTVSNKVSVCNYSCWSELLDAREIGIVELCPTTYRALLLAPLAYSFPFKLKLSTIFNCIYEVVTTLLHNGRYHNSNFHGLGLSKF